MLRWIGIGVAIIGCSGTAPHPTATAAATPTASQPPTVAHYELSHGSKEVVPPACRSDNEEGEKWSFDVTRSPGKVHLDEHASKPNGEKHDNAYDCAESSGAFECSMHSGYDYNAQHSDANVMLSLTYKGKFVGDDRIEGSAIVDFACTGTKCSDVAPTWSVSQFPCTVTAAFTGHTVRP